MKRFFSWLFQTKPAPVQCPPEAGSTRCLYDYEAEITALKQEITERGGVKFDREYARAYAQGKLRELGHE